MNYCAAKEVNIISFALIRRHSLIRKSFHLFLQNQKITEKLKFQRTFLSNMHFPRKKANNQLWKMFVFPPRGFGNLSTQFVCPGLSWEYEYTLYIIHTTKHNPEHLLILVKAQSLGFGESHDEKIQNFAVSVNGH